MLGNFTYCNPTRLYFGEDSLNHLKQELERYGSNVLLCCCSLYGHWARH